MKGVKNIISYLKKKLKRIRFYIVRLWRSLSPLRRVILISIILIVACNIVLNMQRTRDIDASRLLSVIAKGESRGNYNAYYGNVNNKTVKFTEMTVEEVLAWQKSFVAQGQPSSAIGKYQFIEPTLSGLVQELKIEPNTKFDEQLQDRLAQQLLKRRGLHEYVDGKISNEQFAHSLSKEWAALPRVTGENPAQSYYAGDGLNSAQISVEEVKSGIGSISEIK